MLNLKDYRVCLFDFDFTLCDSGDAITMCYRHVLNRNGFREGITDLRIRQMIGTPLYDALVLLTGVDKPETVNRFCDEFQAYADEVMAENTLLYPFTMPLLRRLKQDGKSIGIISTKERRHITASFDRYGMHPYIDLLIAVDDNVAPKPDPGGILLAMSRLGGAPENTLYIGDSHIDAAAAQNAGIAFVGVTTGTTAREELSAYPHAAILENAAQLTTENPY